jgi:AcrR family transcriptional regulator
MSASAIPSPEKPRKSLAEQSKEKILFTAMELFARNGYHKTPAASIAKATGISHGLLFYHFGSKEKLLQAIVDYSIRKIEKIVTVESTEPALQLTELGTNFKRSLLEDRDFWELYHSLIFQPDLKKEIAQQLTGAFEDYRKELVRIFEKLGYLSPTDTMLQFEAMRHGIMVSFLVQGKDYPVDKLFRNLIDRFS